MIRYEHAPDIQEAVKELAIRLNIRHDFSRIVCIRSRGSKSRRTLARCHALPRIMQKALNVKAHYVIEAIGENFDSLGDEEKVKTLIHEIMHIPKSFGGGFRHHDYVCKRNVEALYRQLQRSQPTRSHVLQADSRQQV